MTETLILTRLFLLFGADEGGVLLAGNSFLRAWARFARREKFLAAPQSGGKYLDLPMSIAQLPEIGRRETADATWTSSMCLKRDR